MMQKKDHLLLRYLVFILGLFISAMGVAFSTKAGLGTSPVSSVPYSVSLIWPVLSFGSWLNGLSVLQILVQVLLLRKACNIAEILIQTVLAFVYGYLTNFSCSLLAPIVVTSYAGQLGLLAASCFVLALGIWIQFMGRVAMLPGEAMNRAISQVTGKRYESIKILFDVLYIIISALLCLLFLGKLEGVREGSVIAAVAIGFIIRLYNALWKKLTGARKTSAS